MHSLFKRVFADPDLAIDLGTANTRLFALGLGLIADEPSVVSPRDLLASATIQLEAPTEKTRPSFVSTVNPLRAGVVTDVDAARMLLEPLFWRAKRFGVIKPRALACAPTDVSASEHEALVESMRRAGASAVRVVPEPLAAAVGAGLDVSEPFAQMLVDIGHGVTDVAVIHSGELISTAAVRVACSDMHAAVREMIAQRYEVDLYREEPERLTRVIGTAPGTWLEKSAIASGLNLESGEATSVEVTSTEVSEAIAPIVNRILEHVCETLRELRPTVAAEVIESGICLSGGGAELRGITKLIARTTSLEVARAGNPLHSVINGASRMLALGSGLGIWNT